MLLFFRVLVASPLFRLRSVPLDVAPVSSGWFAVGFLIGKVEADRRLRRRASAAAVA